MTSSQKQTHLRRKPTDRHDRPGSYSLTKSRGYALEQKRKRGARGSAVLAPHLVALEALATLLAAPATADDGWVAIASSPTHEQLDWDFGPDANTAIVKAINQCALIQKADDCFVLAASPDCVAVAWDAAEPLNRPHAASGSSPEAALQAARAAAGPEANDPTVVCTWFSLRGV